MASVYLVLMFVLSSELEAPPASACSSSSFSTAQLSGAVHIGGTGPSAAILDGPDSSCAIRRGVLFGESFGISPTPFGLLTGEVEENGWGLLNTTVEDGGGDGGCCKLLQKILEVLESTGLEG
jgi:hypothetical protein